MIYGFIHPGSGLGNQLHRYIATRVLALDKGYKFSMIGKENFKGSSFMNLDMGKDFGLSYQTEYPLGKIIPSLVQMHDDLILWEEKTNYYNPEFNFIEDETVIDGEFQDERYFSNRINEIDEWLKVEPLDIPYDVCVIGFRGGEFYLYPELGLPLSYFEEGIKQMRKINPNMRFEVHTDDVALATQFFPNFKIVHDIGINWRSMRHAKYAVIANSSFYILPRLLNNGITIAPRYWARYNTGEWSMPQNYYKSFQYV